MEEQTEELKPKAVVDLRKLMDKLGMRSNEFASACGMSSQSMAQFLRKDKSMTLTSVYKMAVALDIDPREMFFPVDEHPQDAPGDLFSPIAKEGASTAPVWAGYQTQQISTTAFCPHCGRRVMAGVVLMGE